MSLASFQKAIAPNSIDLPLASLMSAQLLTYPDLDIAHYLNLIEEIAATARRLVGYADARIDALRLLHFLSGDLHYHGDFETYDDPRNCYLNEVLDRGVGLPITLSVIYIAVAQRVGVRALGVGMPGHFVVRVEDGHAGVIIDMFHGRVLSDRDCAQLVRDATGYRGPFRAEWLSPTPEREIVARMLNNLRVIYMRREEWAPALSTVRLLQLVQPDVAAHLRDEGLICYSVGDLPAAAGLLERYALADRDASDLAVLQRTVGKGIAAWARHN